MNSNWLDTLRYDHRGLYRGLVAVVVMFVLGLVFLTPPDSPMLQAMGVTGVQNGFLHSAMRFIGRPEPQ